MSNTKEKILEVALDLFSQNGYEAVTVEQIAQAVGIKAPSLYKHFSSKQDIFMSLRVFMLEQYERNSIFTQLAQDSTSLSSLTPEEFAKTTCKQVKLITSHPIISKTRRLLTIEQFRNSVLGDELEQHQFKDIYPILKNMIQKLIDANKLINEDIEIMTLQLMSPISVEIERIDRGKTTYAAASKIIKKHVLQFFRIYGKEGK